MSCTVLTAKKFQLAIKNGLVPEELAEKYGCTIEEIKEQLKRIYHADDGSKAQSVYGQLEANRKKSHRRKTAKIVPMIEPILIEDNDEVEPESGKSLADLRQEEDSLSSEVIKLETDHKELSAKHRRCNTTLRELQNQINDIKNSLIDCKSKFEQIATEADEIATQMNDISKLRNQKVSILEKLRQEIEEKSNIPICVYNDGTIEALDNPGYILDDDGYLELKAEIAEKEECLDLRVRDITILARLIKICERIDQFSIICDNTELEKAFWAIR